MQAAQACSSCCLPERLSPDTSFGDWQHIWHTQGLSTHPQCATVLDPEGKPVTKNLVWVQGVQQPFGKGDIGRIRVHKPSLLLSGLPQHSPGQQQAPDPTAPSCTVTPPWEHKVTPEGFAAKGPSQAEKAPHWQRLRRQERRSQLISTQAQALQGATSAIFLA